MRVAIVGSRSIHDSEHVAAAIEASGFAVKTVVTGGARGVDALAERWASRRRIPVVVHPANWGRYGPSAGPIRNQEIVDDADALVAVWDGESAGTADSVRRAQERGIPVFVHRVETASEPKISRTRMCFHVEHEGDRLFDSKKAGRWIPVDSDVPLFMDVEPLLRSICPTCRSRYFDPENPRGIVYEPPDF